MNNIKATLHIENVSICEGEVFVRIQQHETIRYCFFWLRDNCRCTNCYNYTTCQRKNDFLDIPEDPKIQNLSSQFDVLKIKWDDGHNSEYTAKFLLDSWFSTWRKNTVIERVLWSGKEVENRVAYVNKEDFFESDDVLREFLQSIVTYGVAFVDGATPDLVDLKRIVERVGCIEETIWGSVWKFTSDLARADTSYSSVLLGPHTDHIYFSEGSGLLILHCLEHEGEGGDNFLVDAFKWAEHLKEQNPNAFNTLATTHLVGEYIEENYYYKHESPVIIVDPINGQIKQIKYNEYDRNSYCVAPGKESSEFYSAYRALAKLYNSSEAQWRFKLRPGRIMFIDNWRLLHGRTEFSGKRVMGGAYMARNNWMSVARSFNIIH